MGLRGLVAIGLLTVVGLGSALLWRQGATLRTPEPARSTTVPTGGVAHGTAPPNNKLASKSAASAQRPPASLREQLRVSRDYAELVNGLSAAVAQGQPEAEYVSAKALRYCSENLNRFFRLPGGGVRSLGDAQDRWARRPVGYQAEIIDVYDRCHRFLEDPDVAAKLSTWKPLLDRAADSAYPAAESDVADILRTDAVMNGGVIKNGTDRTQTLDDVRALALNGAQSGDPDSLMDMSNWVDSNSHSRDEYGDRVSAWQFEACQRGYDCGKNSDWLRSLCNYDPQCSDADTYVDYFQRHLGSRFDEVQRLANQIGAAIAAGDADAVQSYL